MLISEIEMAEVRKEMWKKLLVHIMCLVLGLVVFWSILLFLDAKEALIAWVMAALLAGGMASARVYSFIKSERQPMGMQLALWSSLTSFLCFFVLSFVIFGGNFLLYEAEDYATEKSELTAGQKLAYYHGLFLDADGWELEELRKTKQDGITFYYGKETDPAQAIEQILGFIKENKSVLEEDLGGKTDAGVSIVLYGDSLEMPERESIQQAYSGFYNEREQMIHLPLPIDQTALAHEYTHHLFLNIAKERGLNASDIPAWFTEGMAVYLAEKETSLSLDLMEETEYVSFKDLETPGQWENHLQTPYRPYFQSGSFIRYIAWQEGADSLSEIFKEMSGSTMQDSFKKATGKNVQAYEKEFIAAHSKLLKQWEEAHLLDVKDQEDEQALKLFLEIADSAPDLDLVNHRIANLYMETGNFEKAIPYRHKELEVAMAEDRGHLSAAYSYLAESLLFTDVPQAVEMAEKALEVSTKDEVFWSEGVLDEISALEKQIAAGEPLTAYWAILNGEFTINKLDSNYREKMALIDLALQQYPPATPEEGKALIAFRGELEARLRTDSQEQLASD